MDRPSNGFASGSSFAILSYSALPQAEASTTPSWRDVPLLLIFFDALAFR